MKPGRALLIGIVLVAVGLAAISTVARFQCVDCTETQLFLNNWPLYLGGGVSILAALLVLRFWGKE
ncbi:MAG: hypothetical protein DCC55_29510 [Chloroflexi bacterium]|nr:MAG: hypothetical protein DCC55_29510 [Chloroflexota bacterium]